MRVMMRWSDKVIAVAAFHAGADRPAIGNPAMVNEKSRKWLRMSEIWATCRQFCAEFALRRLICALHTRAAEGSFRTICDAASRPPSRHRQHPSEPGARRDRRGRGAAGGRRGEGARAGGAGGAAGRAPAGPRAARHPWARLACDLCRSGAAAHRLCRAHAGGRAADRDRGADRPHRARRISRADPGRHSDQPGRDRAPGRPRPVGRGGGRAHHAGGRSADRLRQHRAAPRAPGRTDPRRATAPRSAPAGSTKRWNRSATRCASSPTAK